MISSVNFKTNSAVRPTEGGRRIAARVLVGSLTTLLSELPLPQHHHGRRQTPSDQMIHGRRVVSAPEVVDNLSRKTWQILRRRVLRQ